MLEVELKAAQRRAEAEREARRAQAAARLEAQRRAKAAAAQAVAARDLQAAEERKRAAEKEEAERSAREAELLRSDGVSLSEDLTPSLVDLSTRGIRRSADKIILPPSFRDSLQHQRGHLMGQLAFEVSAESPESTERISRHAVALEFTAPAGQVLLPPPLAAEFTDSEGALPRKMRVKFLKLRKLSFVRLQPLTRAFRKEVKDYRQDLEEALLAYCTLTCGQTVETVSAHKLRVVEAQPDECGLIMESELEVDLAPSLEFESDIQSKLDSLRASQAALSGFTEALQGVGGEGLMDTDGQALQLGDEPVCDVVIDVPAVTNSRLVERMPMSAPVDLLYTRVAQHIKACALGEAENALSVVEGELGRLGKQGSLDPEEWEVQLESAVDSAQGLVSKISKLVTWGSAHEQSADASPPWALRPASAMLSPSMGPKMAFGSGLSLQEAGFARREKLIAAEVPSA